MRRPGNPKKWRAKVLCEGKIADLALVTVEDDQFWTDELLDLQFVDVPELQASIASNVMRGARYMFVCSTHSITNPGCLSCERYLFDQVPCLKLLLQIRRCGTAGLDTGCWLPPWRRFPQYHQGYCLKGTPPSPAWALVVLLQHLDAPGVLYNAASVQDLCTLATSIASGPYTGWNYAQRPD